MDISNQQTASSRLGLVLEGGALRGLFTAGVLDVMMENNLWPDGIVGVSAGAAFGCNMKSRQVGRVIRYNKRYAKDWRYCSLRSLLTTGDMFGSKFCYHDLPLRLDPFDFEEYNRNQIDFYAVCTDVHTGRPVYKLLPTADEDLLEWIRASASMPVVSKIVYINGQPLMDGGISDSIPLAFFQNQGYGRNIVVLTQPRDFVKQPENMAGLVKLLLRKHPRFVEASNLRHLMYNRQLEYIRQQEALGKVLVIAPEKKLPLNHVSHNPRLMQETYELGREQALQRIEDIKDFML